MSTRSTCVLEALTKPPLRAAMARVCASACSMSVTSTVSWPLRMTLRSMLCAAVVELCSSVLRGGLAAPCAGAEAAAASRAAAFAGAPAAADCALVLTAGAPTAGATGADLSTSTGAVVLGEAGFAPV